MVMNMLRIIVKNVKILCCEIGGLGGMFVFMFFVILLVMVIFLIGVILVIMFCGFMFVIGLNKEMEGLCV